MKPIATIEIVGAGAMGAAYAALFSRAGGFDVSFVAGGERYRRLRDAPLEVNGETYRIPVIRPADDRDPADLIIVALKHHHLAGAVADIARRTGEETTILSVMNGLESEETIGAVCGMDKMVLAIALGIDAVRSGGRFTFSNPGRIIFDAALPEGKDDRAARLGEALDRAGIPNEVPPNVMRALWWKFMINVGINQASAVLRAPYGVFQTSAEARALMTSLMEEALVLANREGIDLGARDVDQWCEVMATLSPTGKTSMCQDIEARRKTEVEIFAGKVVSLGERHSVPTPVNATVQRIIRALESGYL